MRYKPLRGKAAWVVIGLYAALSAVWVYWILDQQVLFGNDAGSWATLAVVGVAHIAFGLGLGRWWAMLLPLLPIAMAAPLGYPSANRGEPFPLWLSVAFMAPFEMLLLAIGIAIRVMGARRARLISG